MTRRAPRPLVVGNWKMNLGEAAARSIVDTLVATLPFQHVEVVVAPAFPMLRAVLDAAAGSPLVVGAQNVHWKDQGAFTGEVAPAMLIEMGVRYVIVGHSERRALCGETDDIVALKAVAALRHGLTPVICVGESERERDDGRTGDIVAGQVSAAVADLGSRAAEGIVVAYEPVWAIGTGRIPKPSDVTAAHAAIREALAAGLGSDAAGARVLYGGSVTAANAPSLLCAPSVDGALVGGASLDAASFAAIAAAAAAC